MNGKVWGVYNYMPDGEFMGEKIESENTKNIFSNLYTEQEYIREISIYNYNARFYDNSIGRFYSKDMENEFPSPYVYAGNNSIGFTDPSGNSVFGGILSTVLGIGAIALGIILAPETGGMSLNLSTLGGIALSGALIGAGISSGLYGVTHMNNNFNWANWGVESAIGAGVGIIANGAFLTGIKATNMLSINSSLKRVGATLSGAIIGGGIGFIGNGISNTYYGEDFTSKGFTAIGIGAGIGFIAGAATSLNQSVATRGRSIKKINSYNSSGIITTPQKPASSISNRTIKFSQIESKESIVSNASKRSSVINNSEGGLYKSRPVIVDDGYVDDIRLARVLAQTRVL